MQQSETKCQMLIKKSKKPNVTTININNNIIEHVSNFKYFGDAINGNANKKTLISQKTKMFKTKCWGLLLYVKRSV